MCLVFHKQRVCDTAYGLTYTFCGLVRPLPRYGLFARHHSYHARATLPVFAFHAIPSFGTFLPATPRDENTELRARYASLAHIQGNESRIDCAKTWCKHPFNLLGSRCIYFRLDCICQFRFSVHDRRLYSYTNVGHAAACGGLYRICRHGIIAYSLLLLCFSTLIDDTPICYII